MSYCVVYSGGVRRQIFDVARYLYEQGASPERASQWLESVFDRVSQLEAWPRLGMVDPTQSVAFDAEIRRLVIGDYMCFYRVLDESRQVEVLAFHHGARDR